VEGAAHDPAAESAAAERAAAEALEIEPHDGLALAIRAMVVSYYRRDFDEASDLLGWALASAPNCPLAWAHGALLRCWAGDGHGAVSFAARALRLAPADPYLFFYRHILGQAHYTRDDLEAAAAWAARSASSRPRHLPNLRLLVASLSGLGRTDEARREAARLIEAAPGFRISEFAARTPLLATARDLFTKRLRDAGLPD
jgi:tetratricopeptide (TPR) repeat protein